MAIREPSAFVHLKLRFKESDRAAIEEAAAERGVSLNAEVVDRLRLSLSRREYYTERWGADIVNIVEGMATTLSHIERDTGKRWSEDDKTFDLFSLTVAEMLRSYLERHERQQRL